MVFKKIIWVWIKKIERMDSRVAKLIFMKEMVRPACMVMTKCVTLINYYIYSIMDVFCVKWLQKRTVVEIVYHSDLYDPQYITCMPFKSISYRPLQIG